MAKKVVKREPWTKEDIRTLKTLAREKKKTTSIARLLKRTVGATYQQASKLGVTLGSPSLTARSNADAFPTVCQCARTSPASQVNLGPIHGSPWWDRVSILDGPHRHFDASPRRPERPRCKVTFEFPCQTHSLSLQTRA
jgi:hypothetical protein